MKIKDQKPKIKMAESRRAGMTSLVLHFALCILIFADAARGTESAIGSPASGREQVYALLNEANSAFQQANGAVDGADALFLGPAPLVDM